MGDEVRRIWKADLPRTTGVNVTYTVPAATVVVVRSVHMSHGYHHNSGSSPSSDNCRVAFLSPGGVWVSLSDSPGGIDGDGQNIPPNRVASFYGYWVLEAGWKIRVDNLLYNSNNPSSPVVTVSAFGVIST